MAGLDNGCAGDLSYWGAKAPAGRGMETALASGDIKIVRQNKTSPKPGEFWLKLETRAISPAL